MTVEIRYLYRHMPQELCRADADEAVALHVKEMRLTHASLPELKPQWAINREVAAGRAASWGRIRYVFAAMAGLAIGHVIMNVGHADNAARVEAGE